MLLGTRLDVAQVIETLRQNDNSLEETADYLDLSTASSAPTVVVDRVVHDSEVADTETVEGRVW